MKRKFRSVALYMAVIMMLSFIPRPVYAAPLTDIAGHWAEEYLAYANEQGYVNTYENNTADPDGVITFAEFAFSIDKWSQANEALLRRLGMRYIYNPVLLTDVTRATPHYDSIYTVVSKGLMATDPLDAGDNTIFLPETNVTRQDACVAFARIFKMLSNSNETYFNPSDTAAILSRFTDSEDIYISARDAVAAMVRLGLIEGGEDGRFQPQAVITRAEIYRVLAMADEYLQNPGAENTPVFTAAPASEPEPVQLLNLTAHNVNRYGFTLEFTVNEAAVAQNAAVAYVYTPLPALEMDENTIRITADYQKSDARRISELTRNEAYPGQNVFTLEVPAAFSNVCYVYAMLISGTQKTPITEYAVNLTGSGPAAGSSVISGSDNTVGTGGGSGASGGNKLLLLEVTSKEIATGGNSFGLDISVDANSDQADTDVIIAYTPSPNLTVTADNITNLFGLTSSVSRLRGMRLIGGTVYGRVYTTRVNVWPPNTYYVYVMLRNGTAVSNIIRVEVKCFAWTPTPIPGSNTTPGALATPTPTPTAAPSPTPAGVPTPTPASLPVMTAAAGLNHTLAITSGGALWAWGDNTHGQLGADPASTASSAVPVSIPAVDENNEAVVFTAVAAGDNYSLAVDADGRIWTWGDNTSGVLGQGGGSSAGSFIPAVITVLNNYKVKSISAGNKHVLALMEDGSFWVWGDNTFKQLSAGMTAAYMDVPTRILAGETILQATAGGNVSFVLASDSGGGQHVYAWGVTPPSDADITLPGGLNGNIKQLSDGGGFRHVLITDSSGNIWVWGNNASGQLGNGDTVGILSPAQPPVSIANITGAAQAAAGYGHSVIIKDNVVWAWGDNTHGQLGADTASTASSAAPVSIPATDENNAAAVFSSVYAGDNHTLAIDADGRIWTWGYNANGQLGDGTTETRWTPAAINVPVREP